MTELRMYRGDYQEFTTRVTQAGSGEAFDLTGAKLWFVGKRSTEDPDARAVFLLTTDPGGGIDVADPDAGVAVAAVLPAHTEGLKEKLTKLECAWKVLDADGKPRTLETFDLFVEATALQSTTSVSGGVPLAPGYRPVWYIDTASGDDANDGGTQGRPLRTLSRYVRLTGLEQRLLPGQTIDVFHRGTMLESDRVSMRRVIDDPTSAFRLRGELVALLEGQLTAFTAADPNAGAAGTLATMTAAGLGPQHVGKLVLFPAIDAEARVVKALGGGVLVIDDPKAFGAGRSDITRVAPAATEPFQIVEGSEAYFGVLDLVAAWKGGFSTWPAPFVVENFRCPTQTSFAGSGSFYQRTLVRRCELVDVSAIGGPSVYFRACDILAAADTTLAANVEVQVPFSGCVLRGGILNLSAPSFGQGSQDSNVISALLAFVDLEGQQEGRLALLTAIGGEFSGLRLMNCSYVATHASDVIYGSQVGTNALVLNRGSRFLYKPGFSLRAAGATGRQLLLGDSTELMPSLRPSAGGAVPATASCDTWAKLLAAPFNGRAVNPDTGDRIALDTV